MAEKFKIKAGWTVYKVSSVEVQLWGGLCLCDSCNTDTRNSENFLIPVMNLCYCKKCFDLWADNCKFYEDDVKFEESKIKYWDFVLNIIDINRI